jgi:hypothetical protein
MPGLWQIRLPLLPGVEDDARLLSMTNDIDNRLTPELREAIEAFGNAAFNCGEWQDAPPTYDEVFKAEVTAKVALVEAIEAAMRDTAK